MEFLDLLLIPGSMPGCARGESPQMDPVPVASCAIPLCASLSDILEAEDVATIVREPKKRKATKLRIVRMYSLNLQKSVGNINLVPINKYRN